MGYSSSSTYIFRDPPKAANIHIPQSAFRNPHLFAAPPR
jgi:hypothetical protein